MMLLDWTMLQQHTHVCVCVCCCGRVWVTATYTTCLVHLLQACSCWEKKNYPKPGTTPKFGGCGSIWVSVCVRARARGTPLQQQRKHTACCCVVCCITLTAHCARAGCSPYLHVCVCKEGGQVCAAAAAAGMLSTHWLCSSNLYNCGGGVAATKHCKILLQQHCRVVAVGVGGCNTVVACCTHTTATKHCKTLQNFAATTLPCCCSEWGCMLHTLRYKKTLRIGPIIPIDSQELSPLPRKALASTWSQGLGMLRVFLHVGRWNPGPLLNGVCCKPLPLLTHAYVCACVRGGSVLQRTTNTAKFRCNNTACCCSE